MTISDAAAGLRRAAQPWKPDASVRTQLLSVGIFFGLSLGLAAVAYAASLPPALMPFVLASGPTIIAIAIAWREGRGAVGRLFRSLTIRPRQARWYLTLLIPLVWAPATVAIAVLLGQPTIGLFDKVFPAILIVPLVVLLPAFIEELAWRGFVMPRLMSVMSPLQAALLLGVPWTLVHLVLFLPGQQYDFLAIWPMVLSIFSYSVLLTWIYVGTGGSVLLTALVHALMNGVAPIMAGFDNDLSWAIRNILAAGIAIGLVALGGFRESGQAEPLDSPTGR
jgi:membrane protease YdiL (CAAX protease family)